MGIVAGLDAYEAGSINVLRGLKTMVSISDWLSENRVKLPDLDRYLDKSQYTIHEALVEIADNSPSISSEAVSVFMMGGEPIEAEDDEYGEFYVRYKSHADSEKALAEVSKITIDDLRLSIGESRYGTPPKRPTGLLGLRYRISGSETPEQIKFAADKEKDFQYYWTHFQSAKLFFQAAIDGGYDIVLTSG